MSKSDWDAYSPETQAIRAGQLRSAEQEHNDPIFLTSSYVFSSAAEAAARFSGKEAGNIYSRFSNPTVRAFEERLALLEGGERCIASASGMAAIASIGYALLSAGDHVVCSQAIFGNTSLLFKNFLSRFNVETTFVSLTDYSAWEAAIRPETKLLFLETPSNPLTEIADIPRLADLAHDNDCLFVVDNVFCTPALQQPLLLGADIVVHSATKYIDGQGRCIGGAIVGKQALLDEKILPYMKTCGPALSPFNAWVFLNGLETLSLRMNAHCKNATILAKWLEEQPEVEKVYYPGLESHPQFELAAKQQKGAGGVLSFEVKGGREAAWKLIDSTKLLSITANLGDTKTTITHPATTTHSKLTVEEREATGIKDSLIRVSVGLENCEDIKADLKRGL